MEVATLFFAKMGLVLRQGEKLKEKGRNDFSLVCLSL
jgi:hypothetical protein